MSQQFTGNPMPGAVSPRIASRDNGPPKSWGVTGAPMASGAVKPGDRPEISRELSEAIDKAPPGTRDDMTRR